MLITLSQIKAALEREESSNIIEGLLEKAQAEVEAKDRALEAYQTAHILDCPLRPSNGSSDEVGWLRCNEAWIRTLQKIEIKLDAELKALE